MLVLLFPVLRTTYMNELKFNISPIRAQSEREIVIEEVRGALAQFGTGKESLVFKSGEAFERYMQKKRNIV